MSFVDKFVRLTYGFALFVPINLVILAGAGNFSSPITGVLFALLIACLAYLFHRKGMPWQGAGLGVGFAVMTLVTGGTCTLFTGTEWGEVGGVLYLMVAIVALIIAGIANAVARRSPGPTSEKGP
jgi:hypothetical protein